MIFVKVDLPLSENHTDSIQKQDQPDIYKSGPSCFEKRVEYI